MAGGAEVVPVAAVNPWFGLGASVLGAAVSGQPAGPSSADAVFSTNLGFDNSGWNVSFGSGSPITSTSDKTTSQGGATGGQQSTSNYFMYALLFVGALVAMKAFKK